jgi:YHS domain-containing protein
MKREGGDRWCQIACICGSRRFDETHGSTYLGDRRLFCSPRCKQEFDAHPWVYTFYVFEPKERRPEVELQPRR